MIKAMDIYSDFNIAPAITPGIADLLKSTPENGAEFFGLIGGRLLYMQQSIIDAAYIWSAYYDIDRMVVLRFDDSTCTMDDGGAQPDGSTRIWFTFPAPDMPPCKLYICNEQTETGDYMTIMTPDEY